MSWVDETSRNIPRRVCLLSKRTFLASGVHRNPAELLGDDSLGAGLQMALYDVVGKALEVPAYRLLAAVYVWASC